MSGYMAQTVQNFAIRTVEHLGFVIKSRGNVMVDALLDGETLNVIKVCCFLPCIWPRYTHRKAYIAGDLYFVFWWRLNNMDLCLFVSSEKDLYNELIAVLHDFGYHGFIHPI